MERWPWHLSSAKAWPASATTLKTGIAQLLAAAEKRDTRIRWNGARGAQISSSPFTRRADVERFAFDLTGADIDIDARKAASDGMRVPDPEHDEVVARTRGTIGEARLTADPVTINGRELRAEVSFENAAVDWVVTRSDGELLGTVVAARDDDRRVKGSFRFAMRQEDLVSLVEELVRDVAKAGLKGVPFASLKSFAAQATPTGENRVTVSGGVAITLYALTFSARMGADLEIRPDGSVTVHRATIASKRLLSKLALLPLRGRVASWNGRTFALEDEALRVSELRVDAAHGRLAVSGSLASR